ncbi:MAG: hypothetical protein R3C32_02225 [Chloroflexota bacterium]
MTRPASPPELRFSEHRTAGILADRLVALGYHVRTGVGGTGVVGMLDGDVAGRWCSCARTWTRSW